MQYLSKL